MTSAPRLALAYIEKSPESASRVLSSMPLDVCTAFVEEIPVPLAAQLVAHLQPVVAAKIVQSLDDKAAAAIFRDLDFGKSSAVVRQMDRASRKQFLAKLSKRTRSVLEKSLSFAPGTVGAHMTTTIVTLSESDSVATALDTMRQSNRDHVDLIFVLNDGGSLVGIVSSAVALRHPEAAQLSAVLDKTCPQVSAHSNLEAIADPAFWHDFAYLPVVNRQREVIGAISRRAVKASRMAGAMQTSPGSQSISVSMLTALATTATGLLNLVSTSVADTAGLGGRNEN